MTNQEFYDTTIAHLVVQGRQAYDRGRGACMYRAPDGTKCAVGHHIPDSMYNPNMEGMSLGRLVKYYPVVLEVLPSPPTGFYALDGTSLAEQLQQLHDAPGSWACEWSDDPNVTGLSSRGKEKAHAIAAEFNLVPYPF